MPFRRLIACGICCANCSVRNSAGVRRSSIPSSCLLLLALEDIEQAWEARRDWRGPAFRYAPLRPLGPSWLLRLEHAHRSAVENHVHRPPRLGSRRSLNLRIGINGRPARFPAATETMWAPISAG